MSVNPPTIPDEIRDLFERAGSQPGSLGPAEAFSDANGLKDAQAAFPDLGNAIKGMPDPNQRHDGLRMFAGVGRSHAALGRAEDKYRNRKQGTGESNAAYATVMAIMALEVLEAAAKQASVLEQALDGLEEAFGLNLGGVRDRVGLYRYAGGNYDPSKYQGIDKILMHIRQYESSTGPEAFDMLNGDRKGGPTTLINGKLITQCTVRELIAHKGAKGAFQVMPDTMKDLVRSGVLKEDELFNETAQKRSAIALLHRRGLGKFMAGDLSAADFTHNFAHEWAAFKGKHGQVYAGQGSVPFQQTIGFMNTAKAEGLSLAAGAPTMRM
jgi:hypothetical protein